MESDKSHQREERRLLLHIESEIRLLVIMMQIYN